jgi:acyl-CoA dehydrogenase
MVVGRKQVNDGEEKAALYDPKETFRANPSNVKEGVFPRPA